MAFNERKAWSPHQASLEGPRSERGLPAWPACQAGNSQENEVTASGTEGQAHALRWAPFWWGVESRWSGHCRAQSQGPVCASVFVLEQR